MAAVEALERRGSWDGSIVAHAADKRIVVHVNVSSFCIALQRNKGGSDNRLAGLLRFRGVIALPVDRGHLAAHCAQISGQLATMVNGVDETHLEKEPGRALESPAKIHGSNQ